MSQKTKIGFIVPLNTEAEYLFQTCFDKSDFEKIDNVVFYNGKVNGIDVKMALSGIGLINPAIVTTTMIKHFDPEILIMTGSSGGINLNILGSVVIGKTVYDYNLGTFNPETGRPFYPNSDELYNYNIDEQEPLVLGIENNNLLTNIANQTVEYFKKKSLTPFDPLHDQPIVKSGTIADSTIFYSTKTQYNILKQNDVEVVAFEDISFLKTCWFYNKKAIAMRGVSDVIADVDKANPPELAKFAGKTSSIVAIKFLEFYFNNKNC